MDGGYFENFGATTALEVVNFLKSPDTKLAPFIIFINNDPTNRDLDNVCGTTAPGYRTETRTWFPTIFSPLDALLATREARGSHALAELCDAVGGRENIAIITTSLFATGKHEAVSQRKVLSASWWLSKFVQKSLDDTLLEDRNQSEFDKIRKIMTASTVVKGQ